MENEKQNKTEKTTTTTAKKTAGKIPEGKNVAIVYSDGSAIQHESFGSGVHGYIYNENSLDTKSGDRPSKYHITNIGYLEQELVLKHDHKTVIPTHYINAIYSYPTGGTSNIAEVLAVVETINNIIELEDIKVNHLMIKADSKYTIDMFNFINEKGIEQWKAKEPANVDYGEKLNEAILRARENNLTIELVKVLGHSTSLGNHLADRLAYLARVESIRRNIQNTFKVTIAKKYWTKDETQHTLLKFKQLFFTNTLRSSNPEIAYSILDYKKDDEPGKKSHEATFGLVILKEPPELVEDAIKTYQHSLRNLSIVSTVDMTNLYSQFNSTYYNLFNKNIYVFNRKFTVLNNFDNEPIVKNIHPAGLATQALDKMFILYDIIKEYRLMAAGEQVTRRFVSVTDMIYDKSGKKPVTLLEMGQTNLDISKEVNDIVVKVPIELGKDCLDRNQFKQIEKDDTEVYVVLVQETEKCIKTYVLVHMKATDDIGIFCNFYNNNIFLK